MILSVDIKRLKMKMTIISKEWDEDCKLVKSIKYVLIKKRGKDGLMHTVSEKTEDCLNKEQKQ